MDHSGLTNQKQESSYGSSIGTGLEGNPNLLGRTVRFWHGKGKAVSTLWKRKAGH